MTPRWVVYDEPAGGGGGGPWDPSQLSTLDAWYDADAITGLSNNDPVSTWSDSSPSGYDASSSGSDRPTFVANALNGRPVVRFNGSNHLNIGSTDLFRNVGGGTVYAVAKTDDATSGPQFAFAVWGGELGVRLSLDFGGTLSNGTRRWRTVIRRLNDDSATVVSSTAVVSTNWVLQGAVVDWSGGSATQYIDAVANGTGSTTTGSTSDTATNPNTSLGALNDSNNNTFDGDIAEVVMVNEALSQTDREKVEGYLAHKWGLAGNLPVSHPYKNAAP